MTILTTPGNYAAAHNDLFYVVSDAKALDPVTYPNYKYIAGVYVNGTLVVNLRRFPDPVNKFGVFNIGAIVRNYLQCFFNPAGGLIAMEPGPVYFNLDVQVKFGEEYGTTTTFNIVSDTTRKVFNYYTRLLESTTAPLGNYADKIVTNQTLVNSNQSTFKALLSTDFLLLNYFPTTTAGVNVTVVGNSTYTTTITPLAAYDLLAFNPSPVILNALQPGIISSAIDFYTVTINTQTFRIYLFCEAIHHVYPVHFINQYGGFETVFFNKLSRDSVKIDKKSFGILPYKVANDGSVNYKNSFTYNEANYNYATTFSKSMVLNTDVLTDKEYIWLEDLIESPLVILQMPTYFYPVKITNTDYEIKKQVNESDLTNLTITLDLGRTFNAQFR